MNDKEIIFNLSPYKNRRRGLRKNQTEPERRFWQAVRGKQLGVKFRRQHGIGHYIVDFYCPELALVIELDGDTHFTPSAQAYDKERDNYLRGLGLQVMRFTNTDIMNSLEDVLSRIDPTLVCGEVDPTPALPLPGEGVHPTPALPLPGEGVNPTPALPLPGEGVNSSPCEGGGWEGVTNEKAGLGYGA